MRLQVASLNCHIWFYTPFSYHLRRQPAFATQTEEILRSSYGRREGVGIAWGGGGRGYWSSTRRHQKSTGLFHFYSFYGTAPSSLSLFPFCVCLSVCISPPPRLPWWRIMPPPPFWQAHTELTWYTPLCQTLPTNHLSSYSSTIPSPSPFRFNLSSSFLRRFPLSIVSFI